MKRVMIQFIKAVMVVFIVGNLAAVVALPMMSSTAHVGEEQVEEPAAGRLPSQTALAIAIVVGLSAIAAGIAVGRVGSAAIGAVSEQPELFGRSLVFVGLAEGIAIYGLIIGIMLMQA
jgi:V/A-type H+-transporting ATPase subunit K